MSDRFMKNVELDFIYKLVFIRGLSDSDINFKYQRGKSVLSFGRYLRIY